MSTLRVNSGPVVRSSVTPHTTRLHHTPHKVYTESVLGGTISSCSKKVSCASSRDGRDAREEDEEEPPQSFGQALGNEVRNFFDFANWAPRSSQAWRLGGLDSSSLSSTDEGGMTEENVEVLNQRMAQQRQSMSGSMYNDDDDEGVDEPGVGMHDQQQPSFLRSTDEEFADSLNARITEVATGSASGFSSDEEPEEYLGLDGETLLELIEAKYGKKHDVSFVRRDIPGKTLVSLNIYHAYLGQKSFPMSEEDFKEKMDGVALSLIMWDQVDTVVGFLKSPVRSQRGLPSRPIVGNAVSISLELTREQILEWWGR